jgi:predicted Zn-dependent peptidase
VETVQLEDRLFRTQAPNGITVLSEATAGIRSVAVGVWVKSASVHEARAKMGVSHLLEHMVFKGTERRSAREIALELESRGGSLDAFTSRDYTSFQARVLDEDLPRALDVLTDIVRCPVLRQSDLDLERRVVLEEISTVEDTPDELVFEVHSESLWPEHPYGYSILGTRDTVSSLMAEDLQALHAGAYRPRHVVVAAAGNVQHDALLSMVEECGWLEDGMETEPPRIAQVPAARSGEQRVERESAQTHLVFGTDTFPHRDPRRFALLLLNTVLGHGMSSRLFQRVREELGLAYTVYSYQALYREAGHTGVYVGTHPSTAAQAVAVVREELGRLASDGLAAEELADAQQQLKGQITLSLESSVARMSRLATASVYDERHRTIDELLDLIDSVTREDVAAVAAEFFDPDRQSLVWLGPLEPSA